MLDARVVLSAVNLTQQHSLLTVEEADPAHNYGYAISDGATVTSVEANIGSVTFQSQWGLWQWNYSPSDGPAQSQAVTIVATDSAGASSSVTFQLQVLNVAPTISVQTSTSTEHFGVSFPLGDVSFADEMVEFAPGTNTAFLDASRALGAPQGGDNSRGVTLGNGGSLTLKFTDQPLVDQNAVANGADLVLFDLGIDSEEVTIDISADGNSWQTLPGTFVIDGAEPRGIDISSVAQAGVAYRYVRISDVFLAGEYDPFYVGPDIDAVGVIGNVPGLAVDCGQTATYSGHFGDPGSDTVVVTASIGTVSQSANDEGQWSWSLPTNVAHVGQQTVVITATDKDGATSTVSFELVCHATKPQVTTAQIDVLPQDGRNRINLSSINGVRQHLSNRLVPVVIYSTPELDARTIDLKTVVFAGASVSKHVLCDVDGDGDRDLVAFFKLKETNLYSVYTDLLRQDPSPSYRREYDVRLSGSTRDGQAFEGTDTVRLFLNRKALRELLDQL